MLKISIRVVRKTSLYTGCTEYALFVHCCHFSRVLEESCERIFESERQPIGVHDRGFLKRIRAHGTSEGVLRMIEGSSRGTKNR